jgi:hypothetical protein
MASLAALLAADRRLVILRTLTETRLTANEMVLKQALDHFGHHASSDLVRGDLAWLAEADLVRIEKLPASGGELWLVHLQRAGQDVAEGRASRPGVAQREAE